MTVLAECHLVGLYVLLEMEHMMEEDPQEDLVEGGIHNPKR